MTHSCFNEVSGESLLVYYVCEYFPTTPDYITAHAEVLGGPVLCPAFFRLTMSHSGGVLSRGGKNIFLSVIPV